MGESIRILAVKPKKDSEDLLREILSTIEVNMGFSIKEIDYNREAQIYDKTVNVFADISLNDIDYSLIMIKRTFKDHNVIVDFVIETSTDSSDLNDSIYATKMMIKNELNLFFKGVYWQKDTQNERACTTLYSLIHELENRFREIIVQFMVNKYGFEWTKKISDDLNAKIIGFANWYYKNYNDFKSVKTELFNLQIDDLISLLESSFDNQRISKDEFLSSLLSQENDTEAIEKLIEEYRMRVQDKNVWEKYFVDMLGEEFSGYWEFLKNSRNMVAHNKPICTALFLDTKVMVEKLNEIFDQVEERYSDMFQAYEDIEIEKLWLEYEKDIRQTEIQEMYFEEASIEPTPEREDVIVRITERDEFQTIVGIASEYTHAYAGILDEIRSTLEDGLDNLDVTDHQSWTKMIKELSEVLFVNILNDSITWEPNTVSEMTVDELRERLDEIKQALDNYIESLEGRIEESKIEVEFLEESTMIVLNSHNSILEIRSAGTIFPHRGSSDQLFLELIIDSEIVGIGKIQQNYGAYEIEEYGGAIATHGDEFWIDFKELTVELETFTESKIEYIKVIRDSFFEIFEEAE